MIEFECGHCEKKITAENNQAGKAVKCPSCGQLTLAESGEATSAMILPDGPSVPPPPPSGFRTKSAAKRITRTTASAIVSLVMGVVSLLLPLVFVGGWIYLPFLVLGELVFAIGAGITGMTAVLTPRQSRKGKVLALVGMIMCLAIMLPMAVIYILGRTGIFILTGT